MEFYTVNPNLLVLNDRYGMDFESDDSLYSNESNTTMIPPKHLLAKSKRRDRMARMLFDAGYGNGVYLHLDSKGNVVYSLQTSVLCQVYPKVNEVHLSRRTKLPGNHFSFIWTNKNKAIRIKHHIARNTHQLNRKQRRHERLEQRKALSLQAKEKKQSQCEIDPTAKDKRKAPSIHAKKKNGSKSQNDPQLAGTDVNVNDGDKFAILLDNSDISDEDEDEWSDYKQETGRKRSKKMSNRMKYLFSDAYVNRKRSKRRSITMNCFLADVQLDPLATSSKQEPETYAEIFTTETVEDECSHDPPACNLTLWNFLTPHQISLLGFNRQCKQTRAFESSEDETASFTAIENSVNADDKVAFDTTTTINSLLLDHPEESIAIEKPETVDKKTNSYSSTRNHAIVNLARSSIRPDNLITEFKEKYQEANCKNRRFVLNIRHLARQHLTRMQLLPLGVISHSDFSIYMVFVYVTEVDNDKDKYRVWINTNLPLTKPQDIFNDLVIIKLTSIHELLRKAMEALDNPVVIRFIKNSRKIKESTSHLPTCTFHLLWSSRLKLKLADSSQIDSSVLSVKGQSLTTQIYNKAQQGPAKSSICGICLQEFNINYSFPIALTICSHWFCEECWLLKLYAQIKKQEHKNLLCIERGCHSAVDQATLLCVLDMKLIMKFYNNSTVQKMFRENPRVMLCPNNSCENSVMSQSPMNVLKPNKPDQYMPVRCSCHWQYCSKCLENPHWPVSCDISKIYEKCIEAQCLNSFDRVLTEDELPDLVLRGKTCPRCGIFIQEKNHNSKFEQCACGCVLCWPCGKLVEDGRGRDAHSMCQERFEHSNKALKANIMKRVVVDGGSGSPQISRWFKVALTHRQMRHPQVVQSLYAMADRIASKVYEIAESGKYVGDVKMGSIGWKPSLRKWNLKRCKQLKETEQLTVDNNNIETSSCSDGRSSVLSNCSNDSRHGDEDTNNCLEISNLGKPAVKKENSLVFRAISNIVQMKLEVHYIIEYTAVMLEFEHALNQSGYCGKVIRSLERAEDLSEALGLLLQEPHRENVPRIIPSFLRLRLQVINMLSTLYYNLQLVNY